MASAISISLTKELIKIVQKTSKTEDGQFFRALVAVLWPVLADLYQDRISNPIDLCTIQMKLKDLSYPNITAFEDDIRLIADNAVEFNGPNHVVTTASCAVRDKILEQMDDVRPIADTRARFQNIGQLGTENKDANAPEKTSAISEIVPLDNGLPTSTPRDILPKDIQQIIDGICDAERHLTRAGCVGEAQIWVAAAYAGIDQLEKSGFDTAPCSLKLALFLPPEFELDPQNPAAVRRKREYVLRDIAALKDERRAVGEYLKAIKVEEQRLLVEQKHLKGAIEEVDRLLEQHRKQEEDGERVAASLSTQIHDLLNYFDDDQKPPKSKKRHLPDDDEDDGNDRILTRRRRA